MRATLLLPLLLWLTTASAESARYGPLSCELDGVVDEAVIDGDTVKLLCNPWPDLYVRVRLRLADIDTPELRGAKCAAEHEAAVAARQFVMEWLGDERRVMVSSLRLGSFVRRAVGRLSLSGQRIDLSVALIRAGHARIYYSGKRAGWCDE